MPEYDCCHAGIMRNALHCCITSSAHTRQLGAGLQACLISRLQVGPGPGVGHQIQPLSCIPVSRKQKGLPCQSGCKCHMHTPAASDMQQACLLWPGAACSMHVWAGRLSRAEAAACQSAACAARQTSTVSQEGPHLVKMISSGPRAFTNLATTSLASLYFSVARALRACTPPAGSIDYE